MSATGAGDDQVFGNASEPSAVAVVDRYLAAIGGPATLTAISDRQAKFRNIKFSATGQTEAVIALYMKDGHKYREEWEIKGFQIKDEPLAFTQIYNGDVQEGWVKMLGTVSALEGRTLGVFVWDKYLDDFFAQWKENGYSLRKVGEGLVDEDECDIVECRDFTGRQKIRYFFAKDSGLLLKKEWFDSSGKATVKKEQFYQLYRRISFADGTGHAIQCPLQLDIHVDGELDTRRVYMQVRYNASLSDAIFAKPEGVPFAPEIRSSKDLKTAGATTTVGQDPQGSGGAAGKKAGRRSEGSKKRSRRSGRTAHPTKATPPSTPQGNRF